MKKGFILTGLILLTLISTLSLLYDIFLSELGDTQESAGNVSLNERIGICIFTITTILLVRATFRRMKKIKNAK